MKADSSVLGYNSASSEDIKLYSQLPQPNEKTDTEGKRPEQLALGGSQSITASYAALVIAQLTLTLFMNSFSTGMITVCIPRMAQDLLIHPSQYYWPMSVYSLTAGSCLLLSGAIADVVGRKLMYVVGLFLLSMFVLGSGLAQTGGQLVIFRVLQGVAVSGVFPTSVGILRSALPPGRLQNVGLSFTGIGQPLGFSVGSVLGGVFVQTVGWRVGWYVCAATMFALLLVSLWTLPADQLEEPPSLKKLRTQTDWAGALVACATLAMLAYVLIQTSSDPRYIDKADVIALLSIGLALIPVFVWWMHRQESRGQPALIPNSLWKRLPFTSICIMVLFSFAYMQTMELYCSLFYQNVQMASALRASLQLLPSMILGMILNLTVALFVDRVRIIYITVVSSVFCAVAPLLMALINPVWPYWYAAFPAQILEPLNTDVLYTIGLLVVSEVFPDSNQSLAGAVFNTAGQFGTSFGLAIVGVVSDTVTQKSQYPDKTSPDALEAGYRAGFWTTFAMMVSISLLALFGLRNVGKVGRKQD